MKGVDAGPSIRRFFINTLFDSTFVLLGVVVGSAFVLHPDLEVILRTMILSSLALGISSGVSVYEAETLERAREVQRLENAMLTSLEDTAVTRLAKKAALVVATINLATPLLVCTLCALPFALAYVGTLDITTAAWASILIAIGTLMVAGIYMGRSGTGNALLKGVRMAVVGGVAFFTVYLLGTLI
jgi:predicted membrane protein (TIGR00267 family)